MIQRLLEKARNYISPESQDVYCQRCSAELTNLGGDLSKTGKVYCHGSRAATSCAVWATIETGEIARITYYTPKETQRAIRRGTLVAFGPLENELNKSGELP
jgi:hypothetical protein